MSYTELKARTRLLVENDNVHYKHIRTVNMLKADALALCAAIEALEGQQAAAGEAHSYYRESWSPDCGTYYEVHTAEEMALRDPTGWTPLYTSTHAAVNQQLLAALKEIVKNDPYKQSSAGIIARAAIAAAEKGGAA